LLSLIEHFHLRHSAVALTFLRLRTLHRAETIGSALEGGVNVCQRQLVRTCLLVAKKAPETEVSKYSSAIGCGIN
jgi:hypothetical protein